MSTGEYPRFLFVMIQHKVCQRKKDLESIAIGLNEPRRFIMNNTSEAARAHSEKNWMMMLDGLKQYVEK